MNKLLTHYFLFLFIVAISCQSLSASAASLIIAKNRISSPFLLTSNPSNTPPPKKITNIDHHYYLLGFFKPSNFTKHMPSSPSKIQSVDNNFKALFENNLYKQGKKFLIDYEDNELIQNSLIIFSDTKHHLKETDLMLHNLTNNILLSLELDSSIDYQSTIPQKNTASLLAEERLSLDGYQKQDKDSQLHNTEYLSIYDFLRIIFNFKNLFYLIALATVYHLLKGIIKFIFLQKQRKKNNHRRRKRHT